MIRPMIYSRAAADAARGRCSDTEEMIPMHLTGPRAEITHHHLGGVVRGLERLNAPIELDVTLTTPGRTIAGIIYTGGTLPERVGTIEAVGSINGSKRFTIDTERVSFSTMRKMVSTRQITYKREKSAAEGLLKYGIPLKPEERREASISVKKKELDYKAYNLKNDRGRAARLISRYWEPLVEYVVSGKKGPRISTLEEELLTLIKGYDAAREEYERAVNAQVSTEEG